MYKWEKDYSAIFCEITNNYKSLHWKVLLYEANFSAVELF